MREREREREKEKEKLNFFRTPEENFCEKRRTKNEEEVRRKFQKISLEKQKKKKKKKKKK